MDITALPRIPFRAGAAKVSITPKDDFFPCTTFEDVHLCGVCMPIYVRAIALDNGEKRVVILEFELLAVPRRRALRQRISEALCIPPENVFLAPTHNHSILPIPDEDGLIKISTPVDPQVEKLAALCEEQGVLAARKALESAVPARVGFNTGFSYINVNRDQCYIDGYDEGFDFSAPSDKTVTLLRFETLSGQPIALWSNYAVHPNCEVLAGCENDQAKISGDLAGITSKYLEDRYPGAVALWSNGAEGNQNPIVKNYCPVFNADGSHTWGKIGEGIRMYNEALGTQLALDILALEKGMTFDESLSVSLAKDSINLPGMQIKESTVGTLPNGKWEMEVADPVEVRFQMLALNDIVFFFISGEPVTQIGMHLKKVSPAKHTVIVGISDGHSGYFPDEHGYENHTFEYYLSKVRHCPTDAFTDIFMKMYQALT